MQTIPEDGNRYELFEGELIVTPAPSRDHHKVSRNLTLLLGNYLKKFPIGKLYYVPFDVFFDDETIVQPDIFVILNTRLALIDEKKMNGAPDMVIEIPSPSPPAIPASQRSGWGRAGTEERDRGFKFKRYAQEGVSEYWMVDVLNQRIEVYHLADKGFIPPKAGFGGFSSGQTLRSKLFPELSFSVGEVWE